MSTNEQKGLSNDEHIKRIATLSAFFAGKEIYVKCFPTDNNALHFPNRNFAVKPIEWPTIEPPAPTGSEGKEDDFTVQPFFSCHDVIDIVVC